MEQEKRFKIEKIEKYNEQINEEKKKEIKNFVLIGIFTLATVTSFNLGLISSFYSFYHFAIPGFINSILYAGITISTIKDLFKSISEKTTLEIDVYKLEEELKEFENEESKGMKR